MAAVRLVHAGDVSHQRCEAGLMLLAADVGNTNVVFALFEGREIKHAGVLPPIPAAPATNTRCGCCS